MEALLTCLAYAHERGGRRALADATGAKMPFPEPGVAPNYAPSRRFRLMHLDLSLKIDPAARRCEGEASYRLEALPGFDGEVWLDCDGPQITASEVNGEPVAAQPDGGRVCFTGLTLPCTLTLRFTTHEPRAGLHFTGPTDRAPHRPEMAWTQCQDEYAHHIFPCLDHPGVKHPWRIRIAAPLSDARPTILSNGEHVGSDEDAGWLQTTWEQAGPMPAYLFTAVVGPMDALEDDASVPVRYLWPKGEPGIDADRVKLAFGRTPEMIRCFEGLTSTRYPWPRYDQVVVHDFIFGGMENIACTTMIDLLFVDEPAVDFWHPDRLVCHELAHQWFGDLVTCQDWSQAWLNESFATFMEVCWWEHAFSEAEATWYAYGQARSYLEEDSGRYRRPIASYLFRNPIDVFDRHLYEKGAVVLRTLRSTLGQDGYWAGVREYLTAHAGQGVHGRDLQRAFERATGVNLDRFFQQWIHGAGHPSLTVKLAREDGLLTVSVRQTQSGEQTAEAFDIPLRLEVLSQDGSRQELTLPVRERERVWAIPCSSVQTVRVDPGFSILAEVSIEAPRAWLTALAGDACPVLATRALRALGKDGSSQAANAIQAALTGHAFWAVRGEAAKLLSKRGGDDARAAITSALGNEADGRARKAIASALGAFRDPDAAGALLDALAQEQVPHVRAALATALGKTRDARAADALTPLLNEDSWGDVVRCGALAGLAATQAEASLDPVFGASDTAACSERCVAAAARAMAELGRVLREHKHKVRDTLTELLRSGGFRVRLAAADALAELGDREACGVIEQCRQSDPDARIRRACFEALHALKQGEGASVAALQRDLDALREDYNKLRDRVARLEARPLR